jgi:hypothetical protein
MEQHINLFFLPCFKLGCKPKIRVARYKTKANNKTNYMMSMMHVRCTLTKNVITRGKWCVCKRWNLKGNAIKLAKL